MSNLVELFRILGVTDPEGYASSQEAEGIPHLARLLFLRQAWKAIVSEDSDGWIDAAIEDARQCPSEPYAGVGIALDRLRQCGAADRDLTDVVRGMQAELLFSICSLLDDPGDVEEGLEDIEWAFVQVEAGQVKAVIRGLHESVLETDPTGREMRPRGRGAEQD